MSRLIDADALLAEILEKPNIRYSNLDLIKTIGDSQTVDAVQVVHCRDCKWWKTDWYKGVHRECPNAFCETTADWYCAAGERKEQDDAES